MLFFRRLNLCCNPFRCLRFSGAESSDIPEGLGIELRWWEILASSKIFYAMTYRTVHGQARSASAPKHSTGEYKTVRH